VAVAALAVSRTTEKEHRPQAVMEALEEDLAHLVAVEPTAPQPVSALQLKVLRAEVLVPPLLETHLLLIVAQLVPEMDLFLNLEKP
jgi:hypothetical protein